MNAIDFANIENLASTMVIVGTTDGGLIRIKLYDCIVYARPEVLTTKSDGVVLQAVELMKTETDPYTIRMELLHGENHEFYGYRISQGYQVNDLILCIAVVELLCKKLYSIYIHTNYVPCMPSLELLNKASEILSIYHHARRTSRHTHIDHQKEGFVTLVDYQSKHIHRTPISSKAIRADICEFDVMLNECEQIVATHSHMNLDMKEYRAKICEIMQNLDELRYMLQANA